MAIPTLDLSKMSVETRLALMGQIWDSLIAHGDVPPLSADQEADLEIRIDEVDGGGTTGRAWEDIRREFLQ